MNGSPGFGARQSPWVIERISQNSSATARVVDVLCKPIQLGWCEKRLIGPRTLYDVIIFGVGHSGTSLLTRMVHTLGWNVNDVDGGIRREHWIASRQPRLLTKGWTVDWETSARDILQSFARPFAIKDPRLVETLPKGQRPAEAARRSTQLPSQRSPQRSRQKNVSSLTCPVD